MVLQSPLPRNLHGNHRLRDADPFLEERPLLCTFLRGSVLLHRRRTGVLLRRDICHPFEVDSTGRKGVLSGAAEADSMDFRYMRRDCDGSADSRCRPCRISVFQPEEPEHVQQYPTGRSCISGLRLPDLCDLVLLVSVKDVERHVFVDETVCRCDIGCDVSGLSENLLSTGGNSPGKLIIVRSCLSNANGINQGLEKALSSHEVYFGCLEFAPIVVAVYLFLYYHPGRWLGSKAARVPDQMSRFRSGV